MIKEMQQKRTETDFMSSSRHRPEPLSKVPGGDVRKLMAMLKYDELSNLEPSWRPPLHFRHIHIHINFF